jgi:hypothetical protein
MESILSVVWVALFLTLIVGVFLSAVYSKKCFSSLRTDFPEKWSDMQDEGIFAGEIKTQVNLLKFILVKDYENVGGQELSKLGNNLRILLLIYAPIFLVFFFLTVFMALK